MTKTQIVLSGCNSAELGVARNIRENVGDRAAINLAARTVTVWPAEQPGSPPLMVHNGTLPTASTEKLTHQKGCPVT